MKKTSLDVLVGLFVLLGVAALLFLALKAGNMSGLSFQPTYKVTMRFDNIGGLKARAPVKSAGVIVGRVTGVTFDDHTFQARVTASIDKKYQFPKDSSAKIQTSGLLGEQYVGLEPGGDDKMLKDGDTIEMTQSALVLENLIGQFLYGKAADMGAANGGASSGASAAPAGGAAPAATPAAAFPGAASAMGASGASAP